MGGRRLGMETPAMVSSFAQISHRVAFAWSLVFSVSSFILWIWIMHVVNPGFKHVVQCRAEILHVRISSNPCGLHNWLDHLFHHFNKWRGFKFAELEMSKQKFLVTWAMLINHFYCFTWTEMILASLIQSFIFELPDDKEIIWNLGGIQTPSTRGSTMQSPHMPMKISPVKC